MLAGAASNGPAERRPFRWWRLSHWVLAAAAAPVLAAFTWQRRIASVGDDSVSYLMLAQWLSGQADAFVAPWIWWQVHFPPLFPLALAAAGGGSDLLAAHLVVAAFAAVAVALHARYAALRLGSDAAGFALALAFLLLPTAWISVKGILSESMFLAITLVALRFHETRLGFAPWRRGAGLVMGLLLAATVLTRTAGISLVAAYAACTVVGFATGRDRRPAVWLPLLPVVVLTGAWLALRPGDGQAYGVAGARALSHWLGDPLGSLQVAGVALSDGWLASFLSDSGAAALPRVLLHGLGALALAGALRSAWLNRIDGWYVLFAAALLFVLPYGESNTRRMLYPLVPLALIHATEILLAVAGALGLRRRGVLAGAVLALPLALAVPAMVLIGQKSSHRTPLVRGSDYAPSEITEYYTTVNVRRAAELAARHAAVLGGLERLSRDTPPDARVMWLRPEYVAYLGGRAGVPSYFGWDARRLAREVRDQKVDFIVVAGLFKSDLDQNAGDPAVTLREIEPYVLPRTALANPITGHDEFILLQVHRGALEAHLARAGGSSP